MRQALEPLTALADRTGSAILGLIHVNKSQSVDPLNLIMASKAFPAVARAVLFVMKDPDDESLRLLGQEKNNLGRDNLPTLTFRIESAHVADTAEGPVTTARVAWQGESSQTISEALQSAGEGEARSATNEAGDWLLDYLASQGGEADSADIKKEGAKAGHSQDALKRARPRVKVTAEKYGSAGRVLAVGASAWGDCSHYTNCTHCTCRDAGRCSGCSECSWSDSPGRCPDKALPQWTWMRPLRLAGEPVRRIR